jgi:hypothetical protein
MGAGLGDGGHPLGFFKKLKKDGKDVNIKG